jgi:hypothetical protein
LFWVSWIMVLCLVLGRLAHGCVRWVRDLGVPLRGVLRRVSHALLLGVVLGTVAWGAIALCATWPARWRLVPLSLIYGLISLPLAFTLGFSANLRSEVLAHFRQRR